MIDLRRDLGEDLLIHAHAGAAFHGDRIGSLRKLSIFLTPSLLCVALFRMAHWAWSQGHGHLAWWISHLNQWIHGASLHPAARVGGGLYIPHTVGVIFEGHAGRNLVLYANSVVAGGHNHPRTWDGAGFAPSLGENVTVGAYAVISGAIQVGSRVRVAPCAVVNQNVPDDCTIVNGALSRIHAK